MEDSVLSFLKAEWKVSDTGSIHWASSIVGLYCLYYVLVTNKDMYFTVPAQAPATVEAVGISYTEIVVDWSEIEQKDRCGVLLGKLIII